MTAVKAAIASTASARPGSFLLRTFRLLSTGGSVRTTVKCGVLGPPFAGSARVGGGYAAVDVDDVAGGLGGARAGEEGDRLGDVLGEHVHAEPRPRAVERRQVLL